MEKEIQQTMFRHGLAFYGTIGFLAGFLGARLFATLNPTVVVVDVHSGIHFHHFWYGLGLVTLAGWLGIVFSGERLNRDLALAFGLGVGLVGDEVGLLLTFSDYSARLAFTFFLAAISFIVLMSLLWRFRGQLERDVFGLSNQERLEHLGILLIGISLIFFSFTQITVGFFLASAGIIAFLLGEGLERRPFRSRMLNS